MKFCNQNKLWSSDFKHFGININKEYQTHVTGKAPADHAAQEGPQTYRLQQPVVGSFGLDSKPNQLSTLLLAPSIQQYTYNCECPAHWY
jgi:hypothetical protein